MGSPSLDLVPCTGSPAQDDEQLVCLACHVTGKRKPGTGRAVSYRNVAALPVPDHLPLPTCLLGGRVWLDPLAERQVEPLLAAIYEKLLQRRVRVLIDALSRFISQRRLEILLNLSQGYLSRLRAGAGTPSAQLVSNLAMLAADPPGRLAELQAYWNGRPPATRR